MSFEKASRDRAVLGALHPGMFVEVSTDAMPSFDGGVRERPEQPPRIEWERDFDDPGWVTTEIDAAVLWPGLGQ